MIRVTRPNGVALLLNPELIECIESTPDTVITLSNGRKYVVRETPEDVAEQVLGYRRRIWQGAMDTGFEVVRVAAGVAE